MRDIRYIYFHDFWVGIVTEIMRDIRDIYSKIFYFLVHFHWHFRLFYYKNNSDPGRTRTYNLLIRRQSTYPLGHLPIDYVGYVIHRNLLAQL
jgi:hypothetical protein